MSLIRIIKSSALDVVRKVGKIARKADKRLNDLPESWFRWLVVAFMLLWVVTNGQIKGLIEELDDSVYSVSDELESQGTELQNLESRVSDLEYKLN